MPVIERVDLTEEWKEYRPQTERFSVTFPTTPQHAAQMIPVPDGDGFIRYDMYLALSRKGATFMINVIEYPATFNMADVDSLLNGVMREMIGGNPSNALLNSNHGTFDGNPCLEFLLHNKKATMKTMVVQKDHTIYVLSAADITQELAEEGFKKLENSFKIQ
jgi:hypothetical protein